MLRDSGFLATLAFMSEFKFRLYPIHSTHPPSRQVSLLGPKDDSAMINGPGKQPINKLRSEVTNYALLRRYWGD
jgi:hypothetical protein